MKRKRMRDLENWFKRSSRNPLIIRGARQVGKTWLVRSLARKYKKELLELNFERDRELEELFVSNDPKKTMSQLEIFFNKKINIRESILFLDEIQKAPQLLAKLRWFAEELSELAVIAAGSLLDFILADHKFSMPVGRINYLYLEPMSFEEFLLAKNQEKLVGFLNNYKLTDKIPAIIHDKLLNLQREYIFIGGLPAVINSWKQNESFKDVNETQRNLLTTYREDFYQYAGGRSSLERLLEVFNNISRLLGKKFQYSKVNKDVQAVTIKRALDLLCRARVAHKILSCHGNGVPLSAETKEKFFKVIFLDVGLVSALLGLNPMDIRLVETRLVNEGGVAEQFVGQMLRTVFDGFVDPELYYWIKEKTGSSAEIDYLMQHNSQIIPVEVKAGSTGALRSLHLFMELKKISRAVRINTDYPNITAINVKNNLGKIINYQLLSIPLYLIEQIHRLLDEI